MGKTAILSVKIIGDATGAVTSLDSVDAAAARTEKTLRAVSAAVLIVIAALVGLGIGAFNAASDLQQASGAVDAVFGAYADGVHEQGRQAAQEVGLAQDQYEQLAAVLGSQLKNMGIAQDQAGDKTSELIALGADLSATFGGSAADAVAALSSLLRGERDPIERYGVSIKQADIDARKAALGLSELTGEAAKQADLQATLALLLDQTGDSAGRFAQESDTASGAQQRANAAWRDAQAALGEAFLPVVREGADLLSNFANFVRDNDQLVLTLAISLGVLAAAIGVMTAAQWLYNIAAAANPVGLVVLAIALALAILIGLTVLIVQHWAEIQAAGEQAFAGVQQSVIDSSEEIEGFINLIIDAINWLARLTSGELLGDSISGLFGFEGIDYTAQIPKFDLGFSSAPKLGGLNTYITNNNTTVQGAIDVDGTARTIGNLMASYGQSSGATAIGGPR